MVQLTFIQLLTAVSLFKTAHSINACPGADTVFTGTGGIRYRICPDTDLVGPTLSLTRNVATVTACAQLCDKSMNCFKAVYDTRTRDCHFKALAGLNWAANVRYDVVQAEQINIARCPYAETTYASNGVSGIYQLKVASGTNKPPENLQSLPRQRSSRPKRAATHWCGHCKRLRQAMLHHRSMHPSRV
jgi:galactose oxidase